MQHNDRVLVFWVVFRALAALPIMALPYQCSLMPREPEPAWVAPPGPKEEQPAPKRETLNGHAKPLPPLTLPDEVIVHAMDRGRPLFVRCFKKAYDADPTVLTYKVRIHIELDGAGAITRVTSDAEAPALNGCLVAISHALTFPAPGREAVVELPLFWRPE